MKFLIDTNVLIPLEPSTQRAADIWTPAALAFFRAATGTGQQLFVHPAARKDIARIREEALRANRALHFEKYTELSDPPIGDDATRSVLGEPVQDSNDWVDNQLLIAVHRDAIDYLVTEDIGVHRNAIALGVRDRVLRLLEATELINRLVPRQVEPPPLVTSTKAYSLLRDDPIFNTLRQDYPGFDGWLARASRDQRDAWYIANAEGRYASIAIVKISDKRPPDRELKLCTFKISEAEQGKKYGELMLRQGFEHCYANSIIACYVTVLPKHAALIALFEQFGFRESGKHDDELVYRKLMVPDSRQADPLGFHIAFGPRHVKEDASAHVVPIKPSYDAILFPRRQQQLALLPQDQPYGNAILKAYLCNAPSRKLRSGDTLFFYRTTDEKCIRHVGVVEQTLVSRVPSEVARFVGLRTVYSFQEIEALCARRDVLAVKFRHARTIRSGITLETACAEGVLKAQPQSILSLSDIARVQLWRLVNETFSAER